MYFYAYLVTAGGGTDGRGRTASAAACSTAGTAQPTARATKLRFLCADRFDGAIARSECTL